MNSTALSNRKKEGNTADERKDLLHRRRPILFQQVRTAVKDKVTMKIRVQTFGLGNKTLSNLELATSILGAT